MAEFKVHPSTLAAKLTLALAALLAAAVVYLSNQYQSQVWLAGLLLPAAMAVSAGARMVTAGLTSLQMSGDRLHYESGLFSKTARSVPLHKVQDVTINQSVGQRILGLGDLSIETAGETSRLTVPSISAPRQVADQILARASQLQPPRNQ